MKKFPRKMPAARGMVRTMVVAGRRAAAAGSVTLTGNYLFYVASVRGGRSDLQVNIVDGVIQPPLAAANRALEVMAYNLGPSPIIDGGFGWNGSAAIEKPYAQQIGEETFESYVLGGISEGDMMDGFGWNGSATLMNPHAQLVGEETFESYDIGGVAGVDLTNGNGWNGSAALFIY